MKTVSLLIVFALMVVAPSCKCADIEPQITQETLKANQAYELDLGTFGDEEGCLITKQATHFSISQIEREAANPERVIYKYVPASDYVGTDEVRIMVSRGWRGDSHSDVTYKTIKFTIAN